MLMLERSQSWRETIYFQQMEIEAKNTMTSMSNDLRNVFCVLCGVACSSKVEDCDKLAARLSLSLNDRPSVRPSISNENSNEWK